MTAAVVVRAADVAARDAGPGATLRFLVETGNGAGGLVRRLADLAPGGRVEGRSGSQELWFVLGGEGLLEVDGQPAVRLRTDRGVLIPSGAVFRLSAAAHAELRLDMVALPAAAGEAAATASPAISDFADCAVETTGDRQFRVLFGPGRGCRTATQFVGEIPPGRAPDHSHPYDEVVLILQGDGIAHIGGAEHALSAGTCAHLPPGLVHCLENTGPGMLRVLGVFHPADSPAAKLQPA